MAPRRQISVTMPDKITAIDEALHFAGDRGEAVCVEAARSASAVWSACSWVSLLSACFVNVQLICTMRGPSSCSTVNTQLGQFDAVVHAAESARAVDR